MNVVCLVVDRLHVGYLGCYGNTWVATPQLDRLAVESFLFDQAFTDTTDLADVYASYWQGRHAWQRRAAHHDPAAATLPELLRGCGLRTTLMTDEPAVAAHPLARHFDQQVVLPRPSAESAAAEIEATHLAAVTATAAQWLDQAEEPFFLWLHTQAMAAPWDAPYALRQRYVDENEPPPPALVEVPQMILPADFDPDVRLGIAHAYAGQVALFDTCLGMLADEIRGAAWGQRTLLVVTSPRGMPLGEHGCIGPAAAAPFNESAHVPWLFRLPELCTAPDRSQALVGPPDLPHTILDWLGHKMRLPGPPVAGSLLPVIRGEVQSLRDRALTLGGDQLALRTPAWCLVTPPVGAAQGGPAALYARPDDFWEVNDVADRCPQILDRMLAALADCQQWMAGQSASLAPCDDALLLGH